MRGSVAECARFFVVERKAEARKGGKRGRRAADRKLFPQLHNDDACSHYYYYAAGNRCGNNSSGKLNTTNASLTQQQTIAAAPLLQRAGGGGAATTQPPLQRGGESRSPLTVGSAPPRPFIQSPNLIRCVSVDEVSCGIALSPARESPKIQSAMQYRINTA